MIMYIIMQCTIYTIVYAFLSTVNKLVNILGVRLL